MTSNGHFLLRLYRKRVAFSQLLKMGFRPDHVSWSLLPCRVYEPQKANLAPEDRLRDLRL